MPRVAVTGAAFQERQPLIPLRQQRLRCIPFHACGRHFNCQRQAVQSYAQLRNRCSILRIQLKLGIDGLRTLNKKLDGRIGFQFVPGRRRIERRKREGATRNSRSP